MKPPTPPTKVPDPRQAALVEQQVASLLRAAGPSPKSGERPSSDYLRALQGVCRLATTEPLTATVAGCNSGPGSIWAELADELGKGRVIVWGTVDGGHVADAALFAEARRVLPALLAELLALRAGLPVDEPAAAEESPEESDEEASFAGQRMLWGPGL